MNQTMDFDQTCIDTLLGGGEELIGFYCKVRRTLKCPKYGFQVLTSELVDGFLPNLHRYIVAIR